MDEVRVVALIRTGQTDAFGEVVETYQARIYRYVYRLTGDAELAQDLTQDTFVNAYKSILKTRSELSLSAWLYRIATNLVHSMWRRRKLISFIPLNLQELLVCLNTKTGELIWQHAFNDFISDIIYNRYSIGRIKDC